MSKVYYNKGDEIIDISIRDTSGSKIEVRKCNLSDSKEGGRILKWLIEKWGWKPKVDKSLFDIETDFLSI